MSFIEMIKEKISEIMGKTKAEHQNHDHKAESELKVVPQAEDKVAVKSEETMVETTQVDTTEKKAEEATAVTETSAEETQEQDNTSEKEPKS